MVVISIISVAATGLAAIAALFSYLSHRQQVTLSISPFLAVCRARGMAEFFLVENKGEGIATDARIDRRVRLADGEVLVYPPTILFPEVLAAGERTNSFKVHSSEFVDADVVLTAHDVRMNEYQFRYTAVQSPYAVEVSYSGFTLKLYRPQGNWAKKMAELGTQIRRLIIYMASPWTRPPHTLEKPSRQAGRE